MNKKNPSLSFIFALHPSFHNYFIINVENKTPYRHLVLASLRFFRANIAESALLKNITECGDDNGAMQRMGKQINVFFSLCLTHFTFNKRKNCRTVLYHNKMVKINEKRFINKEMKEFY